MKPEEKKTPQNSSDFSFIYPVLLLGAIVIGILVLGLRMVGVF